MGTALAGQLARIAETAAFQRFVTTVILAAGVVVGLETYPTMVDRHGSLLDVLNDVILVIFVVEILIKLGAEGSRPLRYFTDPWNCFDFAIVAACLLPFDAQAITVLRLLRLLRVLRLLKALPKLQVLVGALLKSIPSMGYVSLLLMILFYLYAVAGVFLFRDNDPVHFQDLQVALLSLFRIVTLEDWTDIMYINMYGCDAYGYGDASRLACTAPEASPVLGIVFFVSFVLLGTMVILNLFIGVIMSGMEEAQAEQEREYLAAGVHTLDDELGHLEHELSQLHHRIAVLRKSVR